MHHNIRAVLERAAVDGKVLSTISALRARGQPRQSRSKSSTWREEIGRAFPNRSLLGISGGRPPHFSSVGHPVPGRSSIPFPQGLIEQIEGAAIPSWR